MKNRKKIINEFVSMLKEFDSSLSPDKIGGPEGESGSGKAEKSLFGNTYDFDPMERRVGKKKLQHQVPNESIIDLFKKIMKGGFWLSSSKGTKEEIEAYQKFLGNINYDVEITGKYDDLTKEATKELQEVSNAVYADYDDQTFKIDGVFGKGSLKMLIAAMRDLKTEPTRESFDQNIFPNSTLDIEIIKWLVSQYDKIGSGTKIQKKPKIKKPNKRNKSERKIDIFERKEDPNDQEKYNNPAYKEFLESQKMHRPNQNMELAFPTEKERARAKAAKGPKPGPNRDFYADILKDLGAPETEENMKFLGALSRAEGPASTRYKHRHNPFNTHKNIAGVKLPRTSTGEKDYPTRALGIQASAATFRVRHYKNILAKLKSGKYDAIDMAAEVGELNKWCLASSGRGCSYDGPKSSNARYGHVWNVLMNAHGKYVLDKYYRGIPMIINGLPGSEGQDNYKAPESEGLSEQKKMINEFLKVLKENVNSPFSNEYLKKNQDDYDSTGNFNMAKEQENLVDGKSLIKIEGDNRYLYAFDLNEGDYYTIEYKSFESAGFNNWIPLKKYKSAIKKIKTKGVDITPEEAENIKKTGKTVTNRKKSNSISSNKKKKSSRSTGSSSISTASSSASSWPLPASVNGIKFKQSISSKPQAVRKLKIYDNEEKPHRGIDIACPVNTPILSIDNGKVIMVRRCDSSGYATGRGKDISYIIVEYPSIQIVDHSPGYKNDIPRKGNLIAAYFHISRSFVKKGDTVSSGQVIGLTGGLQGELGSGRSTGPHLHLGLGAWDKKHPNGSMFWNNKGGFLGSFDLPVYEKLILGMNPSVSLNDSDIGTSLNFLQPKEAKKKYGPKAWRGYFEDTSRESKMISENKKASTMTLGEDENIKLAKLLENVFFGRIL